MFTSTYTHNFVRAVVLARRSAGRAVSAFPDKILDDGGGGVRARADKDYRIRHQYGQEPSSNVAGNLLLAGK